MLDEGKESVSTVHSGKSQKRTQNRATWGAWVFGCKVVRHILNTRQVGICIGFLCCKSFSGHM